MAAPPPASAHVVGNAFVSQYYNVLRQSPHIVHRFYTDASRLTRAEAGGPAETVMAQEEIQKKVMSLDYGDYKAEIKTVDSQESLTGAVMVMVTGSLYKNSGKRNFVQSFFLAPQEKGYYVHNDIFRYLDEEPQVMMQPVHAVANGLVEPISRLSTASESEHEVRDLSPSHASDEEAAAEDMYELADHTEISEADELADRLEISEPEEEDFHEETQHPEIPKAVTRGLDSTPIQSPTSPVDEAPGEKKSYASILRDIRHNAAAPAVQPGIASPRAAPVIGVIDHSVSTQQNLAPAAFSSITAAGDALNDSAHLEDEADGRSVYVKNLPMSITASQLEEVFGKFGPIKPNGINVRSQKQGGCFAFVEFEDAISAQSVIEASPIPIGGRSAYIEEKRPMSLRGGRGRPPQGRGGFRNDGMRGRGIYGGRGFARGIGQDRDKDFMSRDRGSVPSRGGHGVPNQRFGNSTSVPSANAYDSYHGTDSQGGNGARRSWRGTGNKIPYNASVVQAGSSSTAT